MIDNALELKAFDRMEDEVRLIGYFKNQQSERESNLENVCPIVSVCVCPIVSVCAGVYIHTGIAVPECLRDGN